MSRKLFKKLAAVILSALILLGCAPSVFAAASDDVMSEEYEPGAVIVGLKEGAPSIEELLPGFEIAESDFLTPGSSNLTIYCVRFKEKTADIVWRAIEVLQKSPYVLYAEPNFYDEPSIEPATPRENLAELVSEYSSGVDEKDYTPESYKIFRKAYENANKLLADDTATDDQLNKAYGDLLSAGYDLVKLEDVPVYTDARDILETVISECAGVDARDYSPGSYRLFTEAYENAVKLLEDESASDKELEDAYMSLLGEKVRMVTVDRETGKRSRTDEWMAGYEFGAILTELCPGSPKVQSLLSDFDISSISIYPYDNPKKTIIYVRFKEKTEEIVSRAIEVLKASSYVSSAEPHYWNLFDYIPDDGPRYRLQDEVKAYSLYDSKDYTEESFGAYTLAYENAVKLLADANATDEQLEAAYSQILKAKFYLVKVTEPTESATSTPASGPLKEELEEGYEFGAVLVGLTVGGPTVEQLLADFEIESSRFLIHGSSNHNVYCVKFVEKTKEIVWKAIEVLEESPYVLYAEPNYYGHFEVEPTDSNTNTTEPTEQTTESKQPDTGSMPTVTNPTEAESDKATESIPSEPDFSKETSAVPETSAPTSGEGITDSPETTQPITETYEPTVKPTDETTAPATEKIEPTSETAEPTTPTQPVTGSSDWTTDENEPTTDSEVNIDKFTVSGIKDKTFTGKTVTQDITIKNGETTLKLGTDYEVSYKNNKKVGKACVTITGKGNYVGTIIKTFKINPKGTSVSKATPKKKSFTVKWKKSTKQTAGYEIQYSLKKGFKGADKIKIKSNKITSKTIKKLKSRRTYYVRIRTYQAVKGKKFCSGWSKAKTVVTK